MNLSAGSLKRKKFLAQVRKNRKYIANLRYERGDNL